MAALTRPTTANYQVHESVQVDTQDNEDHTFCGIMFPVKVKRDLPVSQVVINSVAVRGQLGPMTVWVSNRGEEVGGANGDGNEQADQSNRGEEAGGANGNGNEQADQQQPQQRRHYEFPLRSRNWTQIYKADHKPSRRQYADLDFSSNPIVIRPGEVRAIYIHSSSQGDEGVVYDNSSIHPHRWHGHHLPPNQRHRRPMRADPRYEDGVLAIHSARAHLSPRPFGQTPIWGWGNAWREHREFVGRLNYGVVYQLWNPEIHSRYFSTPRPANDNSGDTAVSQQLQQLQQTGPTSPFGGAVLAILGCQRRWESPWSKLPDECIYYILNMCRFDWFGDTPEQLKNHRRQRARRQRQLEAQARQARLAEEEEAERLRQEAEAAHEEDGDSFQRPPHQRLQEHEEEQADAEMQEAVQPQEVNIIHSDDEIENEEQGDGDDADDWTEDNDVVMSEEEVDSDSTVDDDEEEENNDDEEESDDDDDDDDSDTDWHRAHGYHPRHGVFAYDDVSSDEEDDNNGDDDDDEEGGRGRPGWIHRHLARISLLRAMAGGGNHED